MLAQQFALPLNYRLIVGPFFLFFRANRGAVRAECALAFICPAYQMSQDGEWSSSWNQGTWTRHSSSLRHFFSSILIMTSDPNMEPRVNPTTHTLSLPVPQPDHKPCLHFHKWAQKCAKGFSWQHFRYQACI